jgi:hypothetical protein
MQAKQHLCAIYRAEAFMKANLKYKDSVFTSLFSDPYSALKGVTLPPDIPIVINTLEDVLFMDRINDISFEIGGKLVVLIEHQSTINPNITLRLLMYIAKVYEKIVGDRNIYSTKRMSIPQPEFFVLYNGSAPYPEKSVLQLSDMFKDISVLGLERTNPALDLEVKVLNINEGKNKAVVDRCRLLAQYSAFVSKVREFEKDGHGLKIAIKKAVIYCRDHDILKELLVENASEVMNMLMTEWNWDDALAVRFEEGREERNEEIARNLLAEGATPEFVQKITGLDLETIKQLN